MTMKIKITPCSTKPFVKVEGQFYRTIDVQYLDQVLDGSIAPGRYSSSSQKTLYMSASEQGVAAAMIAHSDGTTSARSLVKLDIVAENIFDLRDADACKAVGINSTDAAQPWQDVVARNEVPRPLLIANKLRDNGANGLIDPSRKAPGLWHLVLFNWNQDAWPIVTVSI
ncbi:MAG: RES family NAD+ phosphorylase [Cohaesibacteraceae bacterium]|nr:RES family NAD+ phosphorylase [Cohaesibacteraceae bacterium]MBL4876438.1 RES family NAD+ phosphorylase [Cohaesibacteraceae bacterium]